MENRKRRSNSFERTTKEVKEREQEKRRRMRRKKERKQKGRKWWRKRERYMCLGLGLEGAGRGGR